MTRRVVRLLIVTHAVLVVLVGAGVAEAHSVNSRFGDFYGGMLHPLSGFEHVLPLVAAAMSAGQQDRRCGRWMLVALPGGLAVGAVAGLFGPALPFIVLVNRLSFVVLGLLVAASWKLPTPVVVFVGVACGIAHGYENTVDLVAGVDRVHFVCGVIVAGFLVTTVLTAATTTLRVAWQQVAVRVAGSWIAAIGILILGLS